MMKLFELVIGDLRRLVAAESAEHARRIGEDPAKNPDIHFLPFEVREFTLPGYVITVTPEEAAGQQEAPSTEEREALKAWLTEHGIDFNPRWSTEKLRELAGRAVAGESGEPNEPEESATPDEPSGSDEPETPDDPDALF